MSEKFKKLIENIENDEIEEFSDECTNEQLYSISRKDKLRNTTSNRGKKENDKT